MFFIKRVDTEMYFYGWAGEVPVWCEDIHDAVLYGNECRADEDYEELKNLGFLVEVK